MAASSAGERYHNPRERGLRHRGSAQRRRGRAQAGRQQRLPHRKT